MDDDTELLIWDMGTFINSTNITSPMMKMDTEGNWYMSYGKGVPNLISNKNGTETRIDYSFNKFHNNNVAYDADGDIFTVSTNTDRVNNNSAMFCFYFGQFYINNPNSNDYQYTWDGKKALEYVYNPATGVYDINRVKRPKMRAYGSGANSTVALAYYDYNHTKNPVRFRYGTAYKKFSSGIV